MYQCSRSYREWETIKFKRAGAHLQNGSIDGRRNDNTVTVHRLINWACCQSKDSLASQTWHWAKRGSKTVGHKSEEVVRGGWGGRCATLEKILVSSDEDARGSVLLAISGARGIRNVSGWGLVDAGAVKVRLCQRLGNLSVVGDDREIIIPSIISRLIWMENE
jgi:hypothetical protein